QLSEKIRLPKHLKSDVNQKTSLSKILDLPTGLVVRVISKLKIPLDKLNKLLVSAGKPMNLHQYISFKLIMTLVFPFVLYILDFNKPSILALAAFAGFMFPGLWLKGQVKTRQLSILRDLPDIIDLLNICVGAGLDFMVSVRRVVTETKDCAISRELKVMLQEVQMGLSRRDALKNLSARVNSTDVSSFVRSLSQADRMGSPITEALKIQAEELRIRRFQQGEESALKAPIKLLIPLLFFILPVVLVIVAGPIMIQFTKGNILNF
ncbi:MAG: type II secretion system F family protein, partial [Candidatus Omnitrophica bacterium]|nr:type II secretion system F family protein [Candidatus Omnitrophota bacterium]